ncbi:RpiB/LacA/LacB family sugar-phosphate isomerase [Candidatus Kaiserbacteria bacterium]|nr:RpiB/LacA/LacB family sugar-phosphate isomerase [Candidatus Kaiserbacteria bacterium]
MRVVFAADHAGFPLKEILKPYVASLGYDVEDVGAHAFDKNDDYPPFMHAAAQKVAADPQGTRAVLIGASGEGEAIAANRVKGVRAVVYYGEPVQKQTDTDGQMLDLVTSTRNHNDANALSLGARFLSEDAAKEAVKKWLAVPFSDAERHVRRLRMLEEHP